MRVHILGVCGTFMGGIAAIAKEAGHDVSGADQNVYPPMSTQLAALGIELVEGYEAPIDGGRRQRRRRQRAVARQARRRSAARLRARRTRRGRNGSPSTCCATNGCSRSRARTARPRRRACSRGSSSTRARARVPDRRRTRELRHLGAARRLEVLRRRGRRVRHGVLRQAREVRALPAAHADRQQHRVRSRRHLRGRRRDPLAVSPAAAHGAGQRARSSRTARTRTSRGSRSAASGRRSRRSARATAPRAGSRATTRSAPSRASACSSNGAARGTGRWSLLGQHNLENALAAIAAAQACRRRAGRRARGARRVQGREAPARACAARSAASACTRISRITRPRSRRRSQGLRSRAPQQRIVAVMEPRSNTMRMGVHRDTLHGSFADADRVFVLGGARPRLGPRRGARAARRTAGRRRRRADAARAAARGAHGRRSGRAHVERQLRGLAALLEQALARAAPAAS